MMKNNPREFISFLVYGKPGIVLTDQQWEAVVLSNHNILLSASAGSGKTTVLVARILYHLYQAINDKNININNFLAITFTNNSAKKMKEDLNNALNIWFNLEDNLENKEYIQKQITLLNDCFIMTFDAFCLEILKTYYMFLPQEFKSEYLTYIENSNNINLLTHLINKSVLDTLKQEKYIKFNDNKFKFSLCESFSKINSIHELNTVVDNSKKNFINLKDNKRLLMLIYDLLVYLFTPLKQKYELILDFDCDYNSINDFLEKFKNLNEKDFKNDKKIFEKIIMIADYYTNLSLNTIELNNLFYELILDIKTKYKKLKIENKIMEFGDIADYVIDIFEYNSIICQKYKLLFKEILIDEYQDTNDLQEKVLSYIVSDNNVFRVGDIKQAIYGFRNANPKLMNNLYQKYVNNSNSKNLMLSTNFRSHPAIIDFNNKVFEPLMNLAKKDSFIIERDLAYSRPNYINTNKAVFFQTINPENLIEFLNKYNIIGNNNSKMIISYTNNQLTKISEIFVSNNISYNFKKDIKIEQDLIVTMFVSAVFVILKENDYLIHLLNLVTSELFKETFDDIANCSNFIYESGLNCFESELYKRIISLRSCNSINEIFNELYLIFYEIGYNLYQIDYLINLYNQEFDDSVDNFYIFWTNLRNKNISALKQETDDNNLELMTIHGSKGLERDDVVFIASDKSKPINKDCYVFNSDLGLYLKNFNDCQNIVTILIEIINEIENISEKLRLLYVATTRAKKRLFILNFNHEKEVVEYRDDINIFFSNTTYFDYLNTFKDGDYLWIENDQLS